MSRGLVLASETMPKLPCVIIPYRRQAAGGFQQPAAKLMQRVRVLKVSAGPTDIVLETAVRHHTGQRVHGEFVAAGAYIEATVVHSHVKLCREAKRLESRVLCNENV